MNQFHPINPLGNQTDRPVTVARAPWEAAEPAPQAKVRVKGSDDTPMQRWAPTPRLRAAVKADPDMDEAYYAAALKMQAAKDGHMGMLPTMFVKPDYTPKKQRKPRAAIVLHSLIAGLGQVTSQSLAEVTGRSPHSMSSELCRLERMGLVRRAGSQGRFVAYEAVK